MFQDRAAAETEAGEEHVGGVNARMGGQFGTQLSDIAMRLGEFLFVARANAGAFEGIQHRDREAGVGALFDQAGGQLVGASLAVQNFSAVAAAAMLADDQRQFAGGVFRKMQLRRDRPAAETLLDTLEGHVLGRHLPFLRQTGGLTASRARAKDDHRR